MKNFDYKSARLLGIIIFICLIFVLIVWHAFQYLPKSADIEKKEQIELPDEQTEAHEVTEEEEFVNNEEENIQNDVPEAKEDATIENENVADSLEPIDENNIESKDEPVDNVQNHLEQAKQYFNDTQYVKALGEYDKALNETNDMKVKASCYEQIATIYAIMKRYGSALAFAQKAYNLAPSTSRELLLARLYYKTGDIDKATKRVNNVLQRDFSADK